jgi:CheY-like chemotaxis protein
VHARPDILVSDIGLPEMDGYQLMEQIRKMDVAQGGGIPAMALTAFARSEYRTRALRAGYQTHLAKPIESTELVRLKALVNAHGGRAWMAQPAGFRIQRACFGPVRPSLTQGGVRRQGRRAVVLALDDLHTFKIVGDGRTERSCGGAHGRSEMGPPPASITTPTSFYILEGTFDFS